MKRRAKAAVLCLTLVLAAGGVARAQTPAGDSPDAVRWSLAECQRMALQNNLDLVIARKDPAIAAQQVAVSDAKFDGVIGAATNYSKSSADNTITDNLAAQRTDGTSDSRSLGAEVSFSHLLDFGATYRATLATNSDRRSSRSINQFIGFLQDQSFEDSGQGLTLRWEMPLLQNFGREVTTSEVVLARSGLDISKDDLRLRALQTVKSVEDAYWDLLASRAALTVARESLALAQDLLGLNRKKVEVGTLAPIEITQADAGVASREEGVIVAETAVRNAEDALRQLLAIPPDDPAWNREIVPTDAPVYEDRQVDGAAALQAASDNRPEIATARKRLRDSELSERVARNQARHSLNLVAQIDPSTGTTDFVANPPANDTTTDSDGRQWQLGLTYGLPLGNRRAKAGYAIASLSREKSELALQNVEQSIRVDVRTAVRNVESGVKRVAAAKSSAVLQRKTLEAEQKKFDNGMSTSFEVLRIQTDLSTAQLAEIRAILDYTKALADLERAKGTLLEARGLRLE